MTLEPSDSPGFLLWHATLRWQREIAAALDPLGLTHVQFVLLACCWWLNKQGERPNQLAVARQAGTDVKMTSQVLRTLEDKGLLSREVDPADTRAKRVRVSAAGAALAPRAIEVVEAVDARFFAPAPAAAAVALLARLANPGSPGAPAVVDTGDDL
jgi:DNA-binding MarR family transcriptional regulator